MASECSLAHGVSLPAHRLPLAFFTSCRLRHGAVRTRANHRVVAAARPAGAVRRMHGSARARYCVRVQSTSDRPCPSFECPQTKSYTPVPGFPDTAAPGRRRCGRKRRRWPYRRRCRCASPTSCSWPASAILTSDFRTEGEFAGGHPAGSVNVPYMYSTGSGMAKNPHFLQQVSTIFGKDDEIIIGCQSGKRSLMAAAQLCSAGFTGVTDIAGGFLTWRENGLPVNGR